MTSRQIRIEAALHALDRASRGDMVSAQETLEQIVARIASVIAFDGVFAGATDPETGFCLGAGLVSDIDEQVCHPIWEHEFLIPDVNKFADLTVTDPVGDLRETTGGQLTRSPRYRMMREVTGLSEELRATLFSGGRPWGIVQLSRQAGATAFTAEDQAFMRRAAPLAGTALRRSLLHTPATMSDDGGPGVIVLDETGRLVSATAPAQRWLDELLAAWPAPTASLVPPALVLGALSTLGESGAAGWRTRTRTRDGRWLTVHAAAMPATRQVAMTLAPAKASEVAPLVMRAYGLTEREIEVTQSVARGLATAEIAATLSVSTYTVRDHLKAVFEKVGVSSRGELSSRLFVDHYHPLYDRALGESFTRIPALLATARQV